MKSFKKCFIMRGYPASGKSTLAQEMKAKDENTEIVSADDFWMKDGKYVFDVKLLPKAHEECFEKFKAFIKAGKNVIVDNTNLRYKDIQKYIDYLVKNNNLNSFIYSVELLEVSFNDIETAIKHRSDQDSGKNIPASRMRDMYKSFKQDIRNFLMTDYKGKISLGSLDFLENRLPFLEESETLTNAIICDLDGTLSLFQYTNGITIRNAYDASSADLDFICQPVAKALSAFYKTGTQIIFVTGREEKFETPTRAFLERVCENYDFNYLFLKMRKNGDFRKDTIIKEEIFQEHIFGKYNITAVFDDRPSVVKMWREKGLFVFDCNYNGRDF